MKFTRSIRYLLLILLAVPIGLSCSNSLDLLDRSCPCGSGWTCCAGVCVPGSSCGTSGETPDADAALGDGLDVRAHVEDGPDADAGDGADADAGDSCSESGVCETLPCAPEYRECYSLAVRSCVIGDSDEACGWHGGECTSCGTLETCIDGRCRREACEDACATKGCCDAAGRCIEYRESGDGSSGLLLTQSDSQCGAGGRRCQPCGVDRYQRPTHCNTRGQCVSP